MNVPTILIARTDADSAKLLTRDIDPRDKKYLVGEMTADGFHKIKGGIDCAIDRGLAYAPYSELGAYGYKFQFVTLAGFHSLNHSMFTLAHNFKDRGMEAYTELQQTEFASEEYGYSATRHRLLRYGGFRYFRRRELHTCVGRLY